MVIEKWNLNTKMTNSKGIGMVIVVLGGIAVAFYLLKDKISGQGSTDPPRKGEIPPTESLIRRVFTQTPEEHIQKEERREHKHEIRSETTGGIEDLIFGTSATVEEAQDWREHEQKTETRQHKHNLKESKKDARARRKRERKAAREATSDKRRARNKVRAEAAKKGIVKTAKKVHGATTKGRRQTTAAARKKVAQAKAAAKRAKALAKKAAKKPQKLIKKTVGIAKRFKWW